MLWSLCSLQPIHLASVEWKGYVPRYFLQWQSSFKFSTKTEIKKVTGNCLALHCIQHPAQQQTLVDVTIGFSSHSSPRPFRSILWHTPAVSSGTPALHTRIAAISLTLRNESSNTLGMCGLIGFLLTFCETYRSTYNVRNTNTPIVYVCPTIRIVNLWFSSCYVKFVSVVYWVNKENLTLYFTVIKHPGSTVNPSKTPSQQHFS